MCRKRILLLCLCFGFIQLSVSAVEKLQISEFLASNISGRLDQDGDASDWLEIYNPNGVAVNLSGWHLTDDATALAKWTFPSTNLGPGAFLLVFASDKNRAVAGGELHSNFQLDGAGEYLALVQPDGITVEFAYAPTFPPQVDNVSYGVRVTATTPLFVSEGKPATWRVPTGPAQRPEEWAAVGFDDSAWASGQVGFGFDAGQVVGGAVSGATTNAARGRPATQSSTAVGFSAALAVDGSLANFTHTLAGQKLPSSWEVNLGTNRLIEEIVLHNRGDGCCGSRLRDITVRIVTFDNKGTNFTSALLNPENVLGSPASIVVNLRNLAGAPVLGGRVRVTRTPDPDLSGTGGVGNADEADVLSLGEVVVSVGSGPLTFKSIVRTDLLPAMRGVNPSALVRIPFLVIADELPNLEAFALRMKYDDGFVAYLNGVKIAAANAPDSLSWDSAALGEREDSAAIAFESFDVLPYKGLIKDGINVLAVQGLNMTAGDDDFLLIPELSGRSALTLLPNYFSQPTPGAANQAGSLGLVADTKFSVDRGFFDAPFEVAITSATTGAEIYYTTNGAAPTPLNGRLYTGPIQIRGTTVLRAVATKPGWTPSDVDTHSYIFLSQVLTQTHRTATNAGYPNTWTGQTSDYAMDPRITTNAANASLMKASLRSLPSVFFSSSISNFFDANRGFYSHPTDHGIDWERPASMEMLGTNGLTEFQKNCGLRVQGGYFRDPGVTRKHSLRVLFKSQYGVGKLRHDLFGSDDAVKEFDTLVLRAGANDGYAWGAAQDTEQFIRNRFGGELDQAMGNPSPHGTFVHVYFNGIYWGLYEVCERPNEDFSASYFGGDPLDWDSINAGDIKNGDLNAWNTFNTLAAAAKTPTDYERLQGNSPDGARNPLYPVYFDRFNYIDYMMANMWGGNWDWPNKNFWFGRQRTTNSTGFKFYMWDFENTMGNDRGRSPLEMVSPRTDIETEWVGKPHYSLKRLAEYKLDFADRVQRAFFNGGVLTPASLIPRYKRLADLVELSILAETARWGDDNLNPPQDIEDWRRERQWILGTYLPQRSDVVFRQFRAAGFFPSLGAPRLSQFGGTVLPGFSLSLSHTNAAGQIYFTVNGTDPRMRGGELSPAAQLYGSPIAINGNTVLRARVKNTTNWSPIVEAPFTTADAFRTLVISEIMYSPPGDSRLPGDEYEFVELTNTGSEALDLSGLSFVSGISYSFSDGASLAPGARFLIVRNLAAFQSRYPGVTVNGVYSGSLANNGESLSLSHSLLGEVLSFSFDDAAPWPLAADGLGFSLVLRNPSSGADPGDASSWRASSSPGGSPGEADTIYTLQPVVINEVVSRNGAGLDFIEVHNPSNAEVAIGGWFLTDDASVPRKYRFANGVVLPAGGFLVVTESQFNPPGSTNAFSLNSSGDQVYLFSGNASSDLTGYAHGFRFGASADGVSFGRHVLSTGEEDFVAQISVTSGGTNSGPRIGPVVITEIHYHPLSSADAFVELRNTSGTMQALYDPAHPTNTWRLNGAGFSFPSGSVLLPGQFALVTGSDPAAFRDRHSIPPEVLVFGPFAGTLQGSGERLDLQRPDALGVGSLDFITLDAIRYNDHGGWPSAADGAGPSLQHADESSYGNDPATWVAATPTPGRSWQGGVRPAITSQPRSVVAIAFGRTNLQVSAVSGEPVAYQWRFNGQAIPGADSPSLLLSNIQPAQAGRYSVVVFGSGGSVVSSNAFLAVLVPATITSHPRNAFGVLGSNVTFTVIVVSATPLSYQWMYEGSVIPNATTASLTLKGLSFANGGNYSCLITDGVGPVESQSALLTIVRKPVVIQPPLSIEVPTGGTASFSAVGDGTLPLTFRWRKNGTTVTNLVVNQSMSFFTLTNVTATSAGRYTVLLTNVAGSSSASAEAVLTVLADTDRDGMPDNWETLRGFNPNVAADALLDADGDGVNNRAEYLAGTDPKDPASYLKVQSIEGVASAVNLQFFALSNRTYSIQFRPSADAGLWQILTRVAARPTNRLETVVDPAVGAPGRFYRLGTPAGALP